MSNCNISIRPLTNTDFDAIESIYTSAVLNSTATYELEPPSRDDLQERLTRISHAGYPCFVAVELHPDGPQIVGYAYASPFRPRPAYRFTLEHSVYVAADRRGCGIGRLLLQAVIRVCERLDFRQLVAVIGDGQENQGSIAFHEKMGFRHSGRLEGSGYKFGRWLDTVFMQLTIGGGTLHPPDPVSMPELRFRTEGGN